MNRRLCHSHCSGFSVTAWVKPALIRLRIARTSAWRSPEGSGRMMSQTRKVNLNLELRCAVATTTGAPVARLKRAGVEMVAAAVPR